MSYTNTALSPVIDAVPHVDSTIDPVALEAAYQNNIYDPRRDVRNQYPMIAQRMLLEPQMREGLNQLAHDVCDSNMFGYKPNARDIAAVRMVAIKGFSMGLDFSRALETIKVIHGMPTIRGPQALHLIRERARGAIVECLESTDKVAVWKLARPGEAPKEFRGTREQVDKAGLPNKNPLWNLYPERLLKWHAFSEGAQELFGDVLMGCYISEEMDLEAKFNRDLDAAVRQSQGQPRQLDQGQGGQNNKPPPNRSRSRPSGNNKQSDNRRQDATSGSSSGHAPAAAARQRAEDRKQKRSESADPPPEDGDGDRDPRETKASRDQMKRLNRQLSALSEMTGGSPPAPPEAWDGDGGFHPDNEEQRLAANKAWQDHRLGLWEEISKDVLEGKVAKSESLTVDEFEKMSAAMLQRIDAFGEP
jgi:hypothetical protein